MSEDFAADVASVAALSEPVRRQLYSYVVSQAEPVNREQAAAAVGVAHHVAKFNLDRLVADGLLDVEYRRPPGRGGPGAGRPAKLYRRADREISVTLPERRYDLASRVMAETITIAVRDRLAVDEALRRAATAIGRRLGQTPDDLDGMPPVEAVNTVLARNGYEPHCVADRTLLANCPFHSLAKDYTQLVCGMNLDLITGLLDELGPGDRCARLDPGPGRCCVTIDAA
ncbi:helix-turn-helix transcriptional regulator [Micromonospora sp. H33]|uniref:helix-turn-helix transcriptional regulator n=1 Tax=Micromonospora sp. H33 TaxID=3452215 RepID=UPI003F8B1B0C